MRRRGIAAPGRRRRPVLPKRASESPTIPQHQQIELRHEQQNAHQDCPRTHRGQPDAHADGNATSDQNRFLAAFLHGAIPDQSGVSQTSRVEPALGERQCGHQHQHHAETSRREPFDVDAGRCEARCQHRYGQDRSRHRADDQPPYVREIHLPAPQILHRADGLGNRRVNQVAAHGERRADTEQLGVRGSTHVVVRSWLTLAVGDNDCVAGAQRRIDGAFRS